MTNCNLFKGIALIAATCSAAIALANAGDTLLMRMSDFLLSAHVAADLDLSKTQIGQCDRIVTEFQTAREPIAQKIEHGSATEVETASQQISKLQGDLEMKLLAVLTPAQTARLLQIGIQQEGTMAMEDDLVAKKLELSPAQRSKIHAIHARTQAAESAYREALGEAIAKIPDPGSSSKAALDAYEAKEKAVIESMKPKEKQFLAVKAQSDREIVAILNPGQRTHWSTMGGKPLKGG